jgi:hypothetical protein
MFEIMGIVKDGRIEFDGPLPWPEGTRVELTFLTDACDYPEQPEVSATGYCVRVIVRKLDESMSRLKAEPESTDSALIVDVRQNNDL